MFLYPGLLAGATSQEEVLTEGSFPLEKHGRRCHGAQPSQDAILKARVEIRDRREGLASMTVWMSRQVNTPAVHFELVVELGAWLRAVRNTVDHAHLNAAKVEEKVQIKGSRRLFRQDPEGNHPQPGRWGRNAQERET